VTGEAGAAGLANSMSMRPIEISSSGGASAGAPCAARRAIRSSPVAIGAGGRGCSNTGVSAVTPRPASSRRARSSVAVCATSIGARGPGVRKAERCGRAGGSCAEAGTQSARGEVRVARARAGSATETTAVSSAAVAGPRRAACVASDRPRRAGARCPATSTSCPGNDSRLVFASAGRTEEESSRERSADLPGCEATAGERLDRASEGCLG